MELENSKAPPEEIEKAGVGVLRAAMVDGDIEMGSVMAGQISAMVKKIEPAGDIINEVVAGATQIMTKMGKMVGEC